MFNFAVMNSNIVENIILADSKEIAEQVTNKICIEYTNENPAGIGYTYDENTNTFIPPVLNNIE
jgi:hypothetical protein